MALTKIPPSGIDTTALGEILGGGSIGSLADVDFTTTPTNGQTLVYDIATDTWKPGTSGGISAQDLLSPFLLMGA